MRAREPFCDKVLAELQADPTRGALAIAKITGASESYVHDLASTAHIKVGVRGGSSIRGISRENGLFLRIEAAANKCSVKDYLNAIVTDARLDAEERDAAKANARAAQ